MKETNRRIFCYNPKFQIYKDNNYESPFGENSHWEFDTTIKSAEEVRKSFNKAFKKLSDGYFHFGKIIMPSGNKCGFVELVDHYDIVDLGINKDGISEGIMVEKEEYMIPT